MVSFMRAELKYSYFFEIFLAHFQKIEIEEAGFGFLSDDLFFRHFRAAVVHVIYPFFRFLRGFFSHYLSAPKSKSSREKKGVIRMISIVIKIMIMIMIITKKYQGERKKVKQ
jgi:hypothetical protein